jgi:hypothetical protein
MDNEEGKYLFSQADQPDDSPSKTRVRANGSKTSYLVLVVGVVSFIGMGLLLRTSDSSLKEASAGSVVSLDSMPMQSTDFSENNKDLAFLDRQTVMCDHENTPLQRFGMGNRLFIVITLFHSLPLKISPSITSYICSIERRVRHLGQLQ